MLLDLILPQWSTIGGKLAWLIYKCQKTLIMSRIDIVIYDITKNLLYTFYFSLCDKLTLYWNFFQYWIFNKLMFCCISFYSFMPKMITKHFVLVQLLPLNNKHLHTWNHPFDKRTFVKKVLFRVTFSCGDVLQLAKFKSFVWR